MPCSDATTLYLLLSTSHNTIACSYLHLTLPNATVAAYSTDLEEVGLLVDGPAVVANRFLFLGVELQTAQLLKYSLTCALLDNYDTTLPRTPLSNPVLAHADQLLFGYFLLLSPVYLNCGLGSYCNLTSGICSSCPPRFGQPNGR